MRTTASKVIGTIAIGLCVLPPLLVMIMAVTHDHDGALLAFVMLFASTIYFLPSIIAAIRNLANVVPVFLVNVLLGWSFIGWVVALIWSASADNKVVVIQQIGETR